MALHDSLLRTGSRNHYSNYKKVCDRGVCIVESDVRSLQISEQDKTCFLRSNVPSEFRLTLRTSLDGKIFAPLGDSRTSHVPASQRDSSSARNFPQVSAW
jgi:hypothetical protein